MKRASPSEPSRNSQPPKQMTEPKLFEFESKADAFKSSERGADADAEAKVAAQSLLL